MSVNVTTKMSKDDVLNKILELVNYEITASAYGMMQL